MANTVVWFMFLLGVGHIVFGLVRFKGPVAEACLSAFPKSPFWAPLLVAPVLIATGYGWIS